MTSLWRYFFSSKTEPANEGCLALSNPILDEKTNIPLAPPLDADIVRAEWCHINKSPPKIQQEFGSVLDELLINFPQLKKTPPRAAPHRGPLTEFQRVHLQIMQRRQKQQETEK